MPVVSRTRVAVGLVAAIAVAVGAVIVRAPQRPESTLEVVDSVATDFDDASVGPDASVPSLTEFLDTVWSLHVAEQWAGAGYAAQMINTTTTTRPVISTTTTARSATTPGGGTGCVIPAYICARESGFNYRALNPSSGAGGMYQFLPSTWNAVARQMGKPWLVGVAPHLADPADQDAAAAWLWAGGKGCAHWSAC